MGTLTDAELDRQVFAVLTKFTGDPYAMRLAQDVKAEQCGAHIYRDIKKAQNSALSSFAEKLGMTPESVLKQCYLSTSLMLVDITCGPMEKQGPHIRICCALTRW